MMGGSATSAAVGGPAPTSLPMPGMRMRSPLKDEDSISLNTEGTDSLLSSADFTAKDGIQCIFNTYLP